MDLLVEPESDADDFDGFQLSFQPVHLLFFLANHLPHDSARGVVVYLLAVADSIHQLTYGVHLDRRSSSRCSTRVSPTITWLRRCRFGTPSK